jgi:hypothetical protein
MMTLTNSHCLEATHLIQIISPGAVIGIIIHKANDVGQPKKILVELYGGEASSLI